MFDPKFEYCKVYEIAPTYGLDVPRGEVVINGIIHPSFLPKDIDIQAWLIGVQKDDFHTLEQPWYLFQIISDCEENGLELDLPQWALEEVINQAKKEKEKAQMEKAAKTVAEGKVKDNPEIGWLFRNKDCVILDCECVDHDTEQYKYYIEIEYHGEFYKTWIKSDFIEIG
jgi:hypothetical protein